MYVYMSSCYSAPSRFLLRGALDYSADTESEFHAEAHEQLRVKDLPRVPMRRLEVDSNPQPSCCKAPNIALIFNSAVQRLSFCQNSVGDCEWMEVFFQLEIPQMEGMEVGSEGLSESPSS